MKSKVDFIYRSLLITRIFVKGWGDIRVLETLFKLRKHFAIRDNIVAFLKGHTSVKITNIYQFADYQLMRGEFLTPLYKHYPFLVNPASRLARFEIILPTKWKDPTHKPVCIHLAGTGDHFYWRRRRFMAKPLMREAGIGAIILENPFYGSRKPDDQLRSNLHYVTDIFVMGACLILECFVLLKWCEKQGFGPLGLTGVSMGGHMASLAAAAWPKPLILVPCLSWTTASSVFTKGVMAKSIDWSLLSQQYYATPALGSLFGQQSANISHYYNNYNKQPISNSLEFSSLLLEIEKNGNNTSIQAENSTTLVKFNPGKIANKFKDVFNGQFLKKYPDEIVFEYMKQLMDEFTDLRNFPTLVDPSLCISLYAIHDAYVPREGCVDLNDIWQGADVRYIKTGHVGAILIYNYLFRQCIIEAFERARKYKTSPNSSPFMLTRQQHQNKPNEPRL